MCCLKIKQCTPEFGPCKCPFCTYVFCILTESTEKLERSDEDVLYKIF